jgi:HD-GYP domain-containing protein (c-di-GMP phosphodiesterase class II)
MIPLKKEFAGKAYQLSLFIAVPLVIFIVILSFALWTYVFTNEMGIISLKANEYVREINNKFDKVESTFNPLIKKLLEREFDTGYDKDALNRIEKELSETVSTIFPVENVNYYRLSDAFYIYDTDFEPDLGRDFGGSDYFLSRLPDLEVGKIYLENLTNEVHSGDVRIYAYTKMPDGSYFEIGIKFHGVNDAIQTLAKEILGGNNAEVLLLNKFTSAEREWFAESLASGKPVFRLRDFIKASYYIGKRSDYGVYNFLINVKFIYPIFMMLMLIALITLLIGFRSIVKRKIDKFSGTFSTPIETLENNVKNFHLTTPEIGPKEVNTEVKEIKSISDSFLLMRTEITNSYEEINAMNEELEAAYFENQHLLNKVETLLNVPDYLLYLHNIEKFIIRGFERILILANQTDFGYVAIIEDGIYRFLDFRGIDLDKMNALRLVDAEFPRSDVVALFNYAEGEYLANHNIPELYEYTKDVRQALDIPIASEKNYYGSMVLITLGSSGNRLTQDDYRIASYFSNYLKGYLMIKELLEIEEDIQKETIYAIIRLLERHDPYTKGHSDGVARLASKFGKYILLSEEKVQDLYWSGIVHDIGKILIPHNILNKPGKLSQEEFEIIKKHPVFAYDVLKENKTMENIAKYIKYHHEKFNGKGYPDGLIGIEIPFESRILTLADSWDAMTAERVYKKGLSTEHALEEIKKHSGIQFDPKLVEKWIGFVNSEQF